VFENSPPEGHHLGLECRKTEISTRSLPKRWYINWRAFPYYHTQQHSRFILSHITMQ